MRTSGLGFSIFLIALGAVLAWAVNLTVEGVDLNMVGVILFVIGLVGTAVALLMSLNDNRTVVQRDRDVVVERDVR